ncbi:hypothetical protein NUSPORA_00425 [Nucleospora cyclopteri]
MEESKNTVLPTHEEYKKEVKEMQKTILGSLFPITKREAPRVTIAVITYFFIGLTYSFIRQFKETVVYGIFNTASISHWLEFFSFIFLYKLIIIMSWVHNSYGVKKGTEYYLKMMIGSFLFSCVLLACNHFLTYKGWAEEISNGNVFGLRRMGVINSFLLILNHFPMVIFYILVETLSSNLMSFVFTSYFNSLCSHFQLGRYLFPVYIGANMSLFVSVYFVNYAVDIIENSSTARNKYFVYCGVLLLISMVLVFVLFLIYAMDRVFKKPLYYGDERSEIPIIKKKTDEKTTFYSTLRVVMRNKYLICMCIMSAGYSFCNSLAQICGQYTFSAFSDYLMENPEKNLQPGFTPTKTNIAFSYLKYESQFVSLFVTFLMLWPLFRRLFNHFGVFLFSLIVVISCVIPYWVFFIFSIINYPFTHNEQNVLFGLKIERDSPSFESEAQSVTIGLSLIRIAKYGLYDIIKENISARIHPQERSLHKGIFDGLANRIGKVSSSIYIVFCGFLLDNTDLRYCSPLTVIIITIMCACWLFSSVYLHKLYNKSIDNDEYINN